MKTIKTTQTQKVLEVLQQNKGTWLPAHFFVGTRVGIHGKVFLSYKAPARLSEIYRDFDTKIERRLEITEGARYYSYKLLKNIYD